MAAIAGEVREWVPTFFLVGDVHAGAAPGYLDRGGQRNEVSDRRPGYVLDTGLPYPHTPLLLFFFFFPFRFFLSSLSFSPFLLFFFFSTSFCKL